MPAPTPRWLLATLVVLAAVGVWGCGGGGGSGHVGASRQQGLEPAPAPHHPAHHRKAHHERSHHEAPPRKRAPTPAFASLCPPRQRTLAGVYHPDRLAVRDPCRRITGVVRTVRSEEDGDVHLGIGLDRPYRSMLMGNNYSEQSGNLVVEFMPRDHGHLTQPGIGQRVTILGAYVDDTEHGWAEIHPVFGFAAAGGRLQRSGPQFGGSPASALSEDALATCRTNTGARCVGYGGVTAAPPPAKQAKPSPEPAGGRCDPGYKGACLDPNASDYDCAGGGGDGPKYVGPVRVVGPDHFGLDTDGDGVGCE